MLKDKSFKNNYTDNFVNICNIKTVNSDIHNTKFRDVKVYSEEIFMQLKLSYCQHKID